MSMFDNVVFDEFTLLDESKLGKKLKKKINKHVKSQGKKLDDFVDNAKGAIDSHVKKGEKKLKTISKKVGFDR